MIKVASLNQLMTPPCQIFTTAGLGYGQAIFFILRKPDPPDSSSCYFEKFDKVYVSQIYTIYKT